MKIDFKSALMGACFVFGLFGLNSFRAPMRDCLTQEQEDVLALLSVVQLEGCGEAMPTLRVTGANLQIVNGVGYTNSTNGVGNLIVGYNGSCGGSHNLVIGDSNAYTSYSGIVAGDGNEIDGARSFVFGYGNVCVTDDGAILSGNGNTINSPYGGKNAIIGGESNTLVGPDAVIIGGEAHNANNSFSVIVGGYGNTGNGDHSVVTGGRGNTCGIYASYSVVSGGYIRSVTGTDDWRAGSLFEDN
jgi:hypothetical protein